MKKLLYLTSMVIAILWLAYVAIGFGVVSSAHPVEFTRYTNENIWKVHLSGTTTVIDFESISLPENDNYVPLNGNEFSSLPGSPKLLNTFGAGLFVGSPGMPGTSHNNFFAPDFFPTSGSQVFSPNFLGSPQGILTIEFATSMIAFGVNFLDVEMDFANSGFDIDQDGILDIKFASNQGDNSQSFLGFIAETPFSSVDIWMSLNLSDKDGVGLDDLQYTTGRIPEASVPELLIIFGSATALSFGLLIKLEASRKQKEG